MIREEDLLRRRNLFEIGTAKALTLDEQVQTFVPTKAFWRVLSPRNHVILGSRGSGKTALARMLSHDHLSLLRIQEAQQIIRERSYIGTYVSTRVEWVGGLRNKPWLSDQELERLFEWRLNVATCQAFVSTVQSCLNTYVSDMPTKLATAEKLAAELGRAWIDDKRFLDEFLERPTLVKLVHYLSGLDYEHLRMIEHIRAWGLSEDEHWRIGPTMAMPLFRPLREGIRLVSPNLAIPETCSWLLCIDEVEFLDPMFQRIINTQLRAHSGNLVFKIVDDTDEIIVFIVVINHKRTIQ